jgi:hypothetical protein
LQFEKQTQLLDRLLQPGEHQQALSVAVFCVTPDRYYQKQNFLNPPPVLFHVADEVANAASFLYAEADWLLFLL